MPAPSVGPGPRAGGVPGPRIGVVIPARHAAGTLAEAVAAVQGDAAQVVIAVDPADPATWAAATALASAAAAGSASTAVCVVANPGGRTPTGLNAALAALDGGLDVVARVDAHSAPGPGYLPRAAAILRATGAAVVGGRQVPVGEGPVGRAVALAMTTAVGSGGARHLVGTTAGPAETAYLGVFDRVWLDRVGGWDDRLDRNQDYELCHRIRQAGGVVHVDPSLAVAYRPRERWGALAAQQHGYGRWKRHVMTAAPASVRPRQLAAPALVAGLAVAAAARGRRGTWAVPAAWLGAIGVTAATVPGRLSPADRARVGLALAVMHLAWGTGWWRGVRPRVGR